MGLGVRTHNLLQAQAASPSQYDLQTSRGGELPYSTQTCTACCNVRCGSQIHESETADDSRDRNHVAMQYTR